MPSADLSGSNFVIYHSTFARSPLLNASSHARSVFPAGVSGIEVCANAVTATSDDTQSKTFKRGRARNCSHLRGRFCVNSMRNPPVAENDRTSGAHAILSAGLGSRAGFRTDRWPVPIALLDTGNRPTVPQPGSTRL